MRAPAMPAVEANVSAEIVEIDNRRNLEHFLRLPWQIYHGTPWVPPLLSDLRSKISPAQNPFLAYARIRLFGAFSSDRVLGRIAAIHNPAHEKEYRDGAGFFGLFECVDAPDVSNSLFEAVRTCLKASGCRYLLGPVNFSTNDESGLLLDNFDSRPTIMTNYCRPYYHGLLQSAGFEKAVDTLSYDAETLHPFPESYQRVLKRVLANPALELRRFNRRDSHNQMAAICNLYNASFSGTWGFVPLSRDEAIHLGKSFLPFADDDLVWTAHYGGKPVGFILGLPDVNEILAGLNGRLWPFGVLKFLAARSQIRAARVVAFGVLPEYRGLGIETALIHKVRTRILEKPYKRAEFSVVMENNLRMRRLLENIGFRLHKRYRIYRRDI